MNPYTVDVNCGVPVVKFGIQTFVHRQRNYWFYIENFPSVTTCVRYVVLWAFVKKCYSMRQEMKLNRISEREIATTERSGTILVRAQFDELKQKN